MAATPACETVKAAGDVWRSAPSVLQRVGHRLDSISGTRARRRLFTASNVEETKQFVKQELAAIRAADRKRYNFDFENMRPLPGRYEWRREGSLEGSNVLRSARRLDFDRPRPGPLQPVLSTPEHAQNRPQCYDALQRVAPNPEEKPGPTAPQAFSEGAAEHSPQPRPHLTCPTISKDPSAEAFCATGVAISRRPRQLTLAGRNTGPSLRGVSC